MLPTRRSRNAINPHFRKSERLGCNRSVAAGIHAIHPIRPRHATTHRVIPANSTGSITQICGQLTFHFVRSIVEPFRDLLGHSVSGGPEVPSVKSRRAKKKSGRRTGFAETIRARDDRRSPNSTSSESLRHVAKNQTRESTHGPTVQTGPVAALIFVSRVASRPVQTPPFRKPRSRTPVSDEAPVCGIFRDNREQVVLFPGSSEKKQQSRASFAPAEYLRTETFSA